MRAFFIVRILWVQLLDGELTVVKMVFAGLDQLRMCHFDHIKLTLERRFPGLIPAIVNAYNIQLSGRTQSARTFPGTEVPS